jgi:hypothetical protein
MARRRRSAAPGAGRGHQELADVIPITAAAGFFTTAPTAPDRDIKPVDLLIGAYRVVCLYRWLRCDSHRGADVNTMVTELRSRHFDALHDGRGCTDARDCHDWGALGEPVVVPVWRVTDHVSWVDDVDHIPWMAGDDVKWFQVSPDDIVTPVDRPAWADASWEQ